MSKILISDASTLILLEKIELLKEMTKRYSFIIPKEVEHEAITKGMEARFPDSFRLHEKVKLQEIVVKDVYDKQKVKEIIAQFNIGKGEAEAVTLWFQEKDATLIIDDHKGMNICKIYAIPFVTALTLVIVAQEKKIIKQEKAVHMIRLLDVYGRYKADLIYEALKMIGEKND